MCSSQGILARLATHTTAAHSLHNICMCRLNCQYHGFLTRSASMQLPDWLLFGPCQSTMSCTFRLRNARHPLTIHSHSDTQCQFQRQLRSHVQPCRAWWPCQVLRRFDILALLIYLAFNRHNRVTAFLAPFHRRPHCRPKLSPIVTLAFTLGSLFWIQSNPHAPHP